MEAVGFNRAAELLGSGSYSVKPFQNPGSSTSIRQDHFLRFSKNRVCWSKESNGMELWRRGGYR